MPTEPTDSDKRRQTGDPAPDNGPAKAPKRPSGAATTREEKLAEALRQNLRRRKAGGEPKES